MTDQACFPSVQSTLVMLKLSVLAGLSLLLAHCGGTHEHFENILRAEQVFHSVPDFDQQLFKSAFNATKYNKTAEMKTVAARNTLFRGIHPKSKQEQFRRMQITI